MTQKQTATPLQSVLAGGAAGGIESLVTYPTEYVKTRQQLLRSQTHEQSPLQVLTETIRKHGIGRLYTGGAAFCVSNASKSGIRFLTFDYVARHMPRDSTSGRPTVAGNLIAGLCAGVAESVAVLTPGENLKTKLIDDGGRNYRSSTHAVRTILATEGLGAFFRGVWPVTLKQSSNAMVRFTTYGFLASRLEPLLGPSTTVVAGALAGVVTVYCTMPFDSVKTRMQSLEGKKLYSGSWDCARKMIVDGGVGQLWKGTTPRLVSGAISFTVYEKVVQLTGALHSLATTEKSVI